MVAQLNSALRMLGVMTLIAGGLYPLAVTGIAQITFAAQAHGSLITAEGQIIGSTLIGQPFVAPKYFWGRPSATAPFPYNANASAGSNLGPTNPALIAQVQARAQALRAADPDNRAPIPVDLVTSSASGLDPHISVAAADYQAARVARERRLSVAHVHALIDQSTTSRTFGVLGEPRVNVLLLNLALDATQ